MRRSSQTDRARVVHSFAMNCDAPRRRVLASLAPLSQAAFSTVMVPIIFTMVHRFSYLVAYSLRPVGRKQQFLAFRSENRRLESAPVQKLAVC